jgi:hypothetical protein
MPLTLRGEHLLGWEGWLARRLAGLDRFEHAGVYQCRGVAQLATLGDIAQQPPHDLAAASFGQSRYHVDLPGLGDRRELSGDLGAREAG